MEQTEYIVFLKKLENVRPHETIYNFLNVIDKDNDENIVSSWLAFILKPEISANPVNAKPLEKLAEFLNISIDIADAKIKREYYLESKRRIDIVIETMNTMIVIENKINSFENNEQTNDYFNQISKKTKDSQIEIKYIYLKPDYNKSKPLNKNFQIVTYGQLLKIWGNIVEADFKCKAYYLYFNEFMKLIREKYSMEQELTFSNEALLYRDHKDKISILEKAFDNACIAVKNKLFSALKEIFSEENGWIIRPTLTYIQIYKNSWQQGIHYELATWPWQREYRGVSFDRLINDEVIIYFCLHAETKNQSLKDEFSKFSLYQKGIENKHEQEKYSFNDEGNCLKSICDIIERLKAIDAEYTIQIDVINKSIVNGIY